LVGAGAVAGDLFSSFVKRRLGLASSSMAIGLDQIPESLFPLLASRILLPLGWLDILAGVAVFFVGELVGSRILFRLKLRDTPY
jgi:CDP-2,3-bis-(O-geranylgeranyl)-sn-glycerol synthase